MKGMQEDSLKLIDDRQSLLIEFVESTKKAEAEAICRNVAVINVAARTQWQASAWYLERRYPDDYGRKDKVDANINMKTEKKMTEEEKKNLVESLKMVINKDTSIDEK